MTFFGDFVHALGEDIDLRIRKQPDNCEAYKQANHNEDIRPSIRPVDSPGGLP